MKTEKYFVDIGEEGSKGLGLLDYCFNKTTQDFLAHAGLSSGMTVLALEELIENEAQIVGIFGSCQVAGVKQ